MKISKEAQLHMETAELLMKGIKESLEAKPDQWGCIPREHSAASIKRRCVQIRQELLQKFVELRRACPEIVKKKHSDGVKYTFAKIFDVYELLAPAMNEWGVDWDIIKEEATRHHENGDPMFFSTYIQHTKNGDRVVWVYEADLTLCWVNVDNPDETQEITLHALRLGKYENIPRSGKSVEEKR